METVPLKFAEHELSDLIRRANGGETIIIVSRTGERVRLEPVAPQLQDRSPGLLKGKLTFPARLFDPMTDEEIDRWSGDAE